MNSITFRQKASSVLLDNYGIRKREGQSSGRFLGRNLALIAARHDRIFAKAEKRRYSKYAIILLLDCSGSMRHTRRIVPACEALYQIRKELNAVGAHTLVCGFNSASELYVPTDYDLSNQDAFNVWGIHKTENPWHYGNHDWKAIERSRNILLGLKEYPGKLIFTFSDGQPTCDRRPCKIDGCSNDRKVHEDLLRSEIRRTREAGIQVLALGIQTDAPLRFYGERQSSMIENPSHIYSSAANLLTRNLQRA